MRHSEADGDTSLHGAIYRELFRSLTTGTPRSGAASAIDLPRPIARSLVHFLSLLSIATYLREDHDLADQLAGAVARWFAALWHEFERAERSREDLVAPLPPVESLSPAALTRAVSAIESLRPSVRDRWSRIRRRIERVTAEAPPVRERSLAAIRAEIESLYRRATRADAELRQERALRQVVTPLADHLNETIPDVIGLTGAVQRHFRTPVQWDLFDTTWRNIDLSIVERAFAIYDADAGLQRLSELIVQGSPARGSDSPGRRQGRDTRAAEAVRHRSHGTSGPPLKRDRTLEAVVPAEVALLAADDTAALFEQRLADGGLLSYRSIPPAARHGDGTIEEAPAAVPSDGSHHPSPVILCVDTSGSMKGLPERVAAAFTLGVLRHAFSRRRPFRILAFQNGLREVAWSPIDETPSDAGEQPSLSAPIRIPEELLLDLTEMLHTELEGGTDTTPVLERALAIVDAKHDDPTDLVVISDITTPKITPSHLNRLYAHQRLRRLRFHALTINRNPMSDPLNVFDYRWHYRDTDPPNGGVDIDSIRGVYLTP